MEASANASTNKVTCQPYDDLDQTCATASTGCIIHCPAACTGLSKVQAESLIQDCTVTYTNTGAKQGIST